MASANNMFKSHEEYRRAKELEEARKAGIAPAAVDEEGKEINPHIPQYMSSAPWYLNSDRPSLKHQKNWKAGAPVVGLDTSYDRGVKVFQAHRFRKGACENCGAMTHKTKECMERPRAKGARWTNKNIAADEKVEDLQIDSFDAKRDLWNGYDPASYSRVVDLYEKVEAAKTEARKKAELEKRFRKKKDKTEDGEKDGEKKEGLNSSSDESSSSSESEADDEDKITEKQNAGFGKLEKRVRTAGGGASGSVRNLRIREDTAKYLLNLDPASAHYDPKSRSMREDPLPNKDAREKTFRGDNFARKNGDYHTWEVLNLHSHTAYEKGQDIHMQAAPSQAEALLAQFKAKKEALQHASKASVMERYGNAGRAPAPDEAALLLGQTEGYVEYDAAGRVIKGQEVKARSRYEEDVLINNHTAVWGSFWAEGVWGYACCHQTVKNSYCVGAAGKQAALEAAEHTQANVDRLAAEREAAAEAAAVAGKEPLRGVQPGRSVWGTQVEEGLELDRDKLAAAVRRQDEFNAAEVEKDERKRGFNSLKANDTEVTEEDMEAYRLKKSRADDPLTQMKAAGSDGYDLV